MDAFELLVEAHRPAMKAVLAKLVRLLEAHQVRYVIGGANALSLYVRPRMTVDVDAFVDAREKDRLDKLLAADFEVVNIGRFHSKFREGDVEIDIVCAGADAEDFAIANGRDAVILGTRLKAASPEALLLLYLNSEKPVNFADASAAGAQAARAPSARALRQAGEDAAHGAPAGAVLRGSARATAEIITALTPNSGRGAARRCRRPSARRRAASSARARSPGSRARGGRRLRRRPWRRRGSPGR